MHEGHRKRVRERFLTEGLGSFPLHNIIELLLFYSVPRRDTNEIAHRLADKFGSLSSILDAEFEELVDVDGVGENSAVLIKLVRDIAVEYFCDKNKHTEPFTDIGQVADYFKNLFIGDTDEVVRALFLNVDGSPIRCEKVASGSPNSTVLPIREIARLAILYDAPVVAVAHNHPHGIAQPSSEDVRATHDLDAALRAVDVELFEHFVVAGDRCATIKYPDIDLMDKSERICILSQLHASLLAKKSEKAAADA